MDFWTATVYFLVATAVVYLGLSLNGRTEQAERHGDHDHDHGHGGHH